MSIKAVTFDCAQTLLHVRWEPAEWAVACAKAIGLVFDEQECSQRYTSLFMRAWPEYRELNLQRDPDVCDAFMAQIAARWSESCGFPENTPQRMQAVAERLLYSPEGEFMRLFEDVVPCLQRLRSAGYKLAVVSNWDAHLHRTLSNFGLTEYFDVIVASLEEGVEKPDPALFDIALERLGVKPVEAVHVGDSPLDDLVGARNAGMRCFLIDRSQPSSGGSMLGSLTELPDAIARLEGGKRSEEVLSDYDYDLPEDRIAQTPLEGRASSKLLWLHKGTGQVSHHTFRDAVGMLNPGDLLVLNDTRVSAVRLLGHRPTGGAVEALLLQPTGVPGHYVALMQPGKRLPPGSEVLFPNGISAEVTADLGGGRKTIRLSAEGGLDEALAQAGHVPLPPYVHSELDDSNRYQTVYNRVPGSAAAPTAGLHFTQELLAELRGKGVEIATVTLDISVDTFRPVTNERVSEHVIHGERCAISVETAQKVAHCAGRIIAVGTTAVRTLETFAVGPRQVQAGESVSRLFVTPGYEFRVVDGMFTNFHMPRTTMLLMISALAGRDPVMRAYRQALDTGYRFLSFGDAMIIM